MDINKECKLNSHVVCDKMVGWLVHLLAQAAPIDNNPALSH